MKRGTWGVLIEEGWGEFIFRICRRGTSRIDFRTLQFVGVLTDLTIYLNMSYE